jgi:hypothetical protein
VRNCGGRISSVPRQVSPARLNAFGPRGLDQRNHTSDRITNAIKISGVINVFDRRPGRNRTLFLSVVSKVVANRKIISAPIKRMERPRYPNPHLLTGIPEKWAKAAKYWFENARHTWRVRTQNYYFLLGVGRWLGTKHPAINGPEDWDRNLAVQCLTMITNIRCGDWRAPCVGTRKGITEGR